MTWNELVQKMDQLDEAVSLPTIPSVYTPLNKPTNVKVAPTVNVQPPATTTALAQPASMPPTAPAAFKAPTTPTTPTAASTATPPNTNAGAMRQSYAQELQNPAVASKFAALMAAEVGGQGQQAQTAFAETVFNRAIASGKTIDQIISDTRYYAPYKDGGFAKATKSMTPDKTAAMQQAINAALMGSNITKGATDAGSASVAASVKRGGYDAVPNSVSDIGGETFYRKNIYKNSNNLSPLYQQ